jgi:hypothetical protein
LQSAAAAVSFLFSFACALLMHALVRGFKELVPNFAIRDAGPDELRLPTSSTCVNLLKVRRPPPFLDVRLHLCVLAPAVPERKGPESQAFAGDYIQCGFRSFLIVSFVAFCTYHFPAALLPVKCIHRVSSPKCLITELPNWVLGRFLGAYHNYRVTY